MAKPVHRDDLRRIVIGVVTIVVGSVIAYVGITVQGGGALPLKTYTEVTAEFDNVGTLKPQQKVTQDGVRVGSVSSIEYVDGRARVTLRLDGDHEVYDDASARVGNESALGKKYVAFDPGTPEAGESEDKLISAERTDDSTGIDDVLAAFDKDARKGLQTILQEVGGGVRGNARNLQDVAHVAPQLLADGERVLNVVNRPGTNLDGLLVTADDLVRQFEGQSRQLATLLDEADTTLAAVNVDDTEPLQATIRDLPATLRTARAGLKALNRPLGHTADAVVELRPGVGHLVDATPDLRGFLRESPPVAQTVVDFTGEAEPAVKALTPVVSDAQPLVKRVERTLDLTDPLLTDLRPYWADAGKLFSLHDLLSGHFTKDKHYFSAMLAFPGVYNASLPDPLADTDPYPGPGNAFGKSYE